MSVSESEGGGVVAGEERGEGELFEGDKRRSTSTSSSGSLASREGPETELFARVGRGIGDRKSRKVGGRWGEE